MPSNEEPLVCSLDRALLVCKRNMLFIVIVASHHFLLNHTLIANRLLKAGYKCSICIACFYDGIMVTIQLHNDM